MFFKITIHVSLKREQNAQQSIFSTCHINKVNI
jgi:hypothetical protein